MTNKEFISFGSIESMHNNVKLANRWYHPEEPFAAKPKLHGTNASIVIDFDNMEVYAQSRKRVITVDDDNAGFARFVESISGDLLNTPRLDSKLIVYGEWAGEGIQKKDAVTQIGKKAFFVICVRFADDSVMTDPKILKTFCEMLFMGHDDVYIIPNVLDCVHLSFSGSVEHLQEVEAIINGVVADYEERDPFIQALFGDVEGPGEGVVVYPKNAEMWDDYKMWSFKAKTKTHSVNKSSKAASAKVEVSPDVKDFAERFATVPRFEQAVSELGIDLEMKNMGKFLKWVNEDVIKESRDELEESELEWKKCAKEITNRARAWYMEQANSFA